MRNCLASRRPMLSQGTNQAKARSVICAAGRLIHCFDRISADVLIALSRSGPRSVQASDLKKASAFSRLSHSVIATRLLGKHGSRAPDTGVKVSEATRRSDDPQCYWRPHRRRLPSRAVLVCRRHFRVFRQVADTSPPRAEDNHPNPCLPWRVRPLLKPQDDKDRFARGSASTITPIAQGPTSIRYPDLVSLPDAPRKLPRSWRFRDSYGARSDGHMSKVVQLRAAIAPRGF